MSNLKIYLAIAVVGFGAGWSVNGWRLSSEHEKEMAEQATVAQETYQRQTETVSEISTENVDKSVKLQAQITELKKELSNAKKSSPAVCNPPADRMRILKDAVSAVNSATGH